MNKINWVSLDGKEGVSYISIGYDKIYRLYSFNSNKEKEKFIEKNGVSTWIAHDNYNEFSKGELTEYRVLMFEGYLWLHDKLEKELDNDAAKSELEEIRYSLRLLRKHMKSITDYINNYDEMKKEFKDL